MLSSEYKAILSMLHVQTNSITVRTTVELVWQRLDVMVYGCTPPIEVVGRFDSVNVDQKENLLKVFCMKKQSREVNVS